MLGGEQGSSGCLLPDSAGVSASCGHTLCGQHVTSVATLEFPWGRLSKATVSGGPTSSLGWADC